MPADSPHSSSDQIKPAPRVLESAKSGSVMIARIVGILCVAGGFILGIQGLDQPDGPMLPTALGLMITGLFAQVFALVRSWYLYARVNT